MPLPALLVAAALACTPDGDRVTVTGWLGIGHIVPSMDPQHRAESYLTITFDTPLCVTEPGDSAPVSVAHAAFLTERPPLRSMMGVDNTYTGSIERGADGTNERYSFVAY